MEKVSEDCSSFVMNTKTFKKISDNILRIIARSPLPEDFLHALNTKEWVLRLFPWAGNELQLAAVAHDLERAVPELKIKRENFPDYESFKKAHAQNSARIAAKIFSSYQLLPQEKERILFLITHHEFGYKEDPEAMILKDADALSFFEVNLLYYAQRNSEEETLWRTKWGYSRLSEKAKPYLAHLAQQNHFLVDWLNKINSPVLKIFY